MHPDDCRYCAAGEPMNHTYEPPIGKSVCPNTSSFYYFGVHLAADTPRSQTAPVRYCPDCLGFGTIAEPR